MNTITPLTSSTGLGSATARSSGQPHWQKNFQAGDMFKATVMEAKGKDLFILDIGGNHLTAQSKALLSPGQTLHLQLVSSSPQIELKIVSNNLQQFFGRSLTLIGEHIDITSLFKNLQQAEISPLKDLHQATVLEAKGDDSFVLDIGGNRIAAQSRTPLSPGQTLQLQVMTTSPQIELKIASSAEQQGTGGTITLFGESTELTNVLHTFQQAGTSLLQSLPPIIQQTLQDYFTLQQSQLSGKDGGEILKNLIDKTGLTLESLLANGDKENAVKTLKAVLFEIAHVLKGATEIVDNTHRILSTLEVYQMAQLHLEDTSHFIFPLPLPFLKNGYLIVEDYGRQKEDTGNGIHFPFRFSLHLTMAELGNIRIDFLQYQDGLYIRFNTDSKEKSDFVESFSADLKQAISNIPLAGLSFSETAADPTAELIQKLLPQGSSMLDTKI
jgi:hypothetical protein